MDVTDIKAQNIKSILNILRIESGITKRELAARTGLSFSTVSNLCNEFRNAGVISEEKSGDYSVGRTPSTLAFHTELFCTLCIDLHNVTDMSITVLTFGNEQLWQKVYDLSSINSVSVLMDLIADTYQQLANELPENARFVGVGAAVPGVVEVDTGLIRNHTLAFLENTPLQQLMSERLGLPCYIEHDTNLCVLSKALVSDDKHSKNIIYISSSTGLGVGVITDGTLLHGLHGYAPEVAHLPFGDPTIQCPLCGSYGCIGNDLAMRGMKKKPDISSPSAVHAFYEDRGKKLGDLISAVVNMFDPSVIYVGGEAFRDFNHLIPYAIPVVRRRSYHSTDGKPEILHDPDISATINRGINQLIYDNWDPLHTRPAAE